MQTLIKKGHKTVSSYMRRAGYILVDVYDTEAGHTAEYSLYHAGVTIKHVIIYFTANWRVFMIEEGNKVYR